MAGGCLATTFVWLQHHGAVRALAASPNSALRRRWLRPLCRGAQRAGVALGGARPGPPLLRARPVPGGYDLRRHGAVGDRLGHDRRGAHAGADEAGNLVAALLPAQAAATLCGRPAGAGGGQCQPHGRAQRSPRTSCLPNWSPASPRTRVAGQGRRRPAAQRLAVARRRRSLLLANRPASGQADQPGRCRPLAAELESRRIALAPRCWMRRGAGSRRRCPRPGRPRAVLRSGLPAPLVAAAGSRSILAGQHPQRLAREALFLLVFGSRPAIKEQPRRRCWRRRGLSCGLPGDPDRAGTIDIVPELPEVEALAADLRERAVGREIDRADVAEFSVLKTYDPPLTALHGARISGTARRGKFLDLRRAPAGGGPRCTWSRTWPGPAGCAGGTRCRRRRRSPARGRWRSGSGSPTAQAST